MAKTTCAVEGCVRPVKTHGWCNRHYLRWRRNGTPAGSGVKYVRLPPVERFWTHVERQGPNDCWSWTSKSRSGGYGLFRVKGRTVRAHRFAYEQLVGPIPDGLQIDHLCRNRSCVNPAHLEPVTHAENQRRSMSPAGINFRKTHCVHGHEFTVENTGRQPKGRTCRACNRIRLAIRRSKEIT